MGSSCHCVAALRLLMLLLVLITMAVPGALGQGTRVGFYLTSCPRAETIVRSTVQTHYRADPTVAPGLLRMHFHDCFVRGCDASILISGSSTERNALPNLNLRGFNVIDDAKAQVEAACPGVVSCADILALAARDSVVLAGGPSWLVPTGRRDGRVSVASDANDLPAFTDSIQEQIRKFRQFNLTVQDLVTLVGGHTIGTSQCQFFRYRLYNFTSDGRPDQTIVASFLPQLRTLCPADGDVTRRVALDNGSGGNFDDSFFRNLRDGRGVLESDQMLFSDPSTRRFIQAYTGLLGGLVGAFGAEFAASMVRMSNIGVNTGTAGEIRTVCAAINS